MLGRPWEDGQVIEGFLGFFFLLDFRGVQVCGGAMEEEAVRRAAFSPPCEVLGVQAAAWYCAYHAPDST